MTNEHEPVGQVGCIDGSILDVSWHSDEVLVEVGGTSIRLSAAAAAARLASLLTTDPSRPGAPTTTPQEDQQDTPLFDAEVVWEGEATEPEEGSFGRSSATLDTIGTPSVTQGGRSPRSSPAHFMIDGRRARVRDLLDAGLLAANEQLTWVQQQSGPMHYPQVLEDGRIRLDDGSGRTFETPSRAARTASGNIASPGWDVWTTADGRTLADLRNELIERRIHDSNQ